MTGERRKIHVCPPPTVEDDQWMHVVRARRLKGSPLTEVERQRVIAGKPWDGSAPTGSDGDA